MDETRKILHYNVNVYIFVNETTAPKHIRRFNLAQSWVQDKKYFGKWEVGRFKYTCIIMTIYFAFNKLVRGVTENKIMGKETIKQITIKTLLNSLKTPLVIKGIEMFLLTASAHPPRHKIIVTQGAGKANKYKSYSLSQKQTIFNQSFSESSRSFFSTQVMSEIAKASYTNDKWWKACVPAYFHFHSHNQVKSLLSKFQYATIQMKARKQLFHGVLFVFQNFLNYKLHFFPFFILAGDLLGAESVGFARSINTS